MLKTSLKALATMAVVCLLASDPRSIALAEPPVPVLYGTVSDQSGAPLQNVRVTLSRSGNDLFSSANTDSRGQFSFAVPVGVYGLQVTADGFETATRTISGTDFSSGPVALTLQIGHRSEAVTVSDTIAYQAVATNSTRTPTPLIDVPQTISVITGQLVKDQQMVNMADVVRYVPGITMAQGEGHRDAPVIRGNTTTSDFYINGVRDDVQYYRDLYNIERVEAVKGANALTFGRGGGGGVINRVSKEAGFTPLREIDLQGGTFGLRRFSTDLNQNFGERFAFRLNGLYENSDSYRDFANVERYGIAPAMTFRASDQTQLRVSYERFQDLRVVDRGVPSWNGLPAPAEASTFFGDPDASHAHAYVNNGSVSLEHQFASTFNLRNTTVVADYDKFYQNVLAGATNGALTTVNLTGYNNLTLRTNLFNQTDVTGIVQTGRFRHTLLAGTEFGRQRSINFRNTAYFGNSTTLVVPFTDPTVRNSGVIFRQSPTDADNQAVNYVASGFVQDQIELNRYVQVVAGMRFDYFSIDFSNNRTLESLGRVDRMSSPRAGVILKPLANLSLYSSYSVAYLPSSGDQFSSLTATTQTLKPEKFNNYEAGAKWDMRRNLSLTTSVYRLDRTNTTAKDPNDPARTVQTGSQRSKGVEVGVNGTITRRWLISGGYAWQDAFITSATAAAVLGARVALVPAHTLSLWNNYRVTSRLSLGLGLIEQASSFASIDNTVRLPSFVRADAAVFYNITERIRFQANVENLSNVSYYPTANNNNNITPGSPRAAKLGLIARF